MRHLLIDILEELLYQLRKPLEGATFSESEMAEMEADRQWLAANVKPGNVIPPKPGEVDGEGKPVFFTGMVYCPGKPITPGQARTYRLQRIRSAFRL